jgi:hypothetical protein
MSKNNIVTFRQYARGAGNRRRGLLVAVVNPITNTYGIGWSLCRREDPFDSEQAFLIAQERAWTDFKRDWEVDPINYAESEICDIPKFAFKNVLPSVLNRIERILAAGLDARIAKRQKAKAAAKRKVSTRRKTATVQKKATSRKKATTRRKASA